MSLDRSTRPAPFSQYAFPVFDNLYTAECWELILRALTGKIYRFEERSTPSAREAVPILLSALDAPPLPAGWDSHRYCITDQSLNTLCGLVADRHPMLTAPDTTRFAENLCRQNKWYFLYLLAITCTYENDYPREEHHHSELERLRLALQTQHDLHKRDISHYEKAVSALQARVDVAAKLVPSLEGQVHALKMRIRDLESKAHKVIPPGLARQLEELRRQVSDLQALLRQKDEQPPAGPTHCDDCHRRIRDIWDQNQA